jgi:hypothetical protein
MKITVDTENVEDLKKLASEIAKAIKLAEENKTGAREVSDTRLSKIMPKDVVFLDENIARILQDEFEESDWYRRASDVWITRDVLMKALEETVDTIFRTSDHVVINTGSTIEWYSEEECWVCNNMEYAYGDEAVSYYDIDSSDKLVEVEI